MSIYLWDMTNKWVWSITDLWLRKVQQLSSVASAVSYKMAPIGPINFIYFCYGNLWVTLAFGHHLNLISRCWSVWPAASWAPPRLLLVLTLMPAWETFDDALEWELEFVFVSIEATLLRLLSSSNHLQRWRLISVATKSMAGCCAGVSRL